MSYLKSAIDAKYYTPLVADIVGLIHVQGGMLNQVGNNELRMLDQFQMGPNLVRGFAPERHRSARPDLHPLYGTGDALGGTKYWGASAELQMPFWFLPKEVGLKGAVYADAGSLWDYKGPTIVGRYRRSQRHWSTGIPCNCGHGRFDDTQCRPHVGRCRLDLGVSVRSAALRLCGPDHQG